MRDAAGEARARARPRSSAGSASSPAERGDAARRQPLGDEARADLEARIERLARRREQLGPVNPLAKDEYAEAVAHVEELETQRDDLESALAELEGLIKETDRRIRESFEETFEAAAKNFEEMVGAPVPGRPRPAAAGAARRPAPGDRRRRAERRRASAAERRPRRRRREQRRRRAPRRRADDDDEQPDQSEPGVEVEVTPAGKSMKRLSLLSGGEKSLVALAFLFAVFLARPCPFYVLDEVEAALDDANIDRFLQLVRRFRDRAQFIIVTHQKRTMDAADCLYGVSMGGDGVSKVISRRLARSGERARARRRVGDGAEAAA